MIHDLDGATPEPSRRQQVAALSLVSAGAAAVLFGVLLFAPIGARGPLVSAPAVTSAAAATSAPVTVTFATARPEMVPFVARGPGRLVPTSCEPGDVTTVWSKDGTTVVLLISDARPRPPAPQAISAVPVQAFRSATCGSSAAPRIDLRILAPY